MSKVVLVMEEPINCSKGEGCPALHAVYTYGTGMDLKCAAKGFKTIDKPRPDWCPLRPIEDIMLADCASCKDYHDVEGEYLCTNALSEYCGQIMDEEDVCDEWRDKKCLS